MPRASIHSPCGVIDRIADVVLRNPSQVVADLRYTRRGSADPRADCTPVQFFVATACSVPLASMVSRERSFVSPSVVISTASGLDVGATQTTGATLKSTSVCPGADAVQHPTHACHPDACTAACVAATTVSMPAKAAAASAGVKVFIVLSS